MKKSKTGKTDIHSAGADKNSNPFEPKAGSAKLSKAEQDLLSNLEEKVKNGLHSFVEVGNALNKINDDRLYRGVEKTFEKYCANKWGFSRQHGHRLMKAAQCYDLLQSKLPEKAVLPCNESQLRPIVARLDQNQWVATWKQVIKQSKGKSPTAEAVEIIVNKSSGKTKPDDLPAKKKLIPKKVGKLKKVVSIVEKALSNKHASTTDLRKALESVREQLRALQNDV
jgi:hypothetical protein